jgi:nucleoside-diphosphate-sugar epimerase
MYFFITGQKGEVGSIIKRSLTGLNFKIIDSESQIVDDDNLRIIHTAAKHRNDATSKLIKSNISYMYSIVEISKKQKTTDFIFCSSVSVYSEKLFGVIEETNEMYSFDLYALTKLLGERILANEKINTVILRLPAVLETKNNNNFMSRILNALSVDETINIRNGESLFNGFVDPEDIASFCSEISIIKHKSEIYNFATHPTLTLISIINILKEITKSKSIINNHKENSPTKIYSIDKLIKTGFKISNPEVSLEKWVVRRLKNNSVNYRINTKN